MKIMITCLGRIVGFLESAEMQALANQCTKFISENPYLKDIEGLEFEVERTKVLTLERTMDNLSLFHDYNGRVVIGCAE